MRQKTWIVAACALLLLPLMAPKAEAVSCSGSFGTLTLGPYAGAATQTSTTAGSITCPSNFAYKIGLSAGVGRGATVALRKMTGPNSVTVNYQIFQDAARAANWGNTSGIDTKSVVGNGGGQGVTVYVLIPANQYVAPGTYQDTVTVSAFNSSPLSTFIMPVLVWIPAACTLSATPLAFGNYAGAQDDTTATITANCTNTTPYNIGLSTGLAPGATATTRAMTGPSSALLRYAVFRDSPRTLNLGNTIGTDTLSGVGTGAAVNFTVYGRIAAGLTVRPGSYADTIIATISY